MEFNGFITEVNTKKPRYRLIRSYSGSAWVCHEVIHTLNGHSYLMYCKHIIDFV